MLDIRTRIRTNLNPSKRIQFRIRSKNIRTVFIPSVSDRQLAPPSYPFAVLSKDAGLAWNSC